jgi:long-chain acyl-CoA synthetase
VTVHTFADPLKRALRVARDSTAVIDGERRFSYAEFDERCRRLAGALTALGVGRGERVAILAANGAPYLETYVGVPASGRVVVPLNTRHAQPELEYALRDSGASVLITDRDPGPLANAVKHTISLPDDYESALAGAEPEPLGQGVQESDLAGLFYTGGTTGKSKGVMLTHRNLVANTFHWLAAVPQQASDRMLIIAPLFHAAGSNAVLGNIWTGGCQVTLSSFDAEAALDLVERHGATGTIAVPTMVGALVEAQNKRPRNTSSLRFIAHGGSPIAVEMLRRCHAAFPSAALIEIYGATELSPLATVFVGEQDHLDSARAKSAGQAIIGVDVEILDGDGKPLPRGEVGEVVVRGPNVMQGYWNLQEQTASVLRDGGYWTGDLGYMDDEGYVYLVDRSKDMIVSGGENVYTTEVEDVLYQHEGVLEAAVFGVPDDKWGEAVWAAVVPRDDQGSLRPDELIEFCRGKIAGYKLPKGIDIHREPLPKSGPGKILKRELRAARQAETKSAS